MMPRFLYQVIVFVFFSFFFGTIVNAQDYTLPSNLLEVNCVFQSEKFDMSIAQKHVSAETDVSAMFQLGIIRPSTLQSVYPLADLEIDRSKATYGFNRVQNQLGINFDVSNTGDAPMDPTIAIEVLKIVGGKAEAIYTDFLTNTFYPGDQHSATISITNFQKYYPFDYLSLAICTSK